MQEDCFPEGTTMFWLRSDFPLEFCFDDWIRQPPSEAEIDKKFPPWLYSDQEVASLCTQYATRALHWCHAYLGIIAKGQTIARPYIWDGIQRLRVPEEGLFQAMLNRLADARGDSRRSHPVIFPKPLINPAREEVWPQWVVLHDSTRSMAGVLTYEAAAKFLRVDDIC
jgi:hypothetical protein